MSNDNWRRLVEGKQINCPICDHDHGCMIATDGEAVICMRVEQGCARRRDGSAVAAKDGMGWLHRLKPDEQPKARKRAKKLPPTETPRLTPDRLEKMLADGRAAMSDRHCQHFSENLGVSTRAIQLYGAGICKGGLSFPMCNGELRPCGIRVRFDDGRKGAVQGSANGLFVPVSGNVAEHPIIDRIKDAYADSSLQNPVLLLPEGPTDAAAAADMGFFAIGRPSARGGVDMLTQMFRRNGDGGCLVVIVSDRDVTKYDPRGVPNRAGWDGALRLARALFPLCDLLKVIEPPAPSKDLRSWLQTGQDPQLLWKVIQDAQFVSRAWLSTETALHARWTEHNTRKSGMESGNVN